MRGFIPFCTISADLAGGPLWHFSFQSQAITSTVPSVQPPQCYHAGAQVSSQSDRPGAAKQKLLCVHLNTSSCSPAEGSVQTPDPLFPSAGRSSKISPFICRTSTLNCLTGSMLRQQFQLRYEQQWKQLLVRVDIHENTHIHTPQNTFYK